MKTRESYSESKSTGNKLTFGAAVRPLANHTLSLMFDFSFIPYYGRPIFDFNSYKAGVDVRLVNGLYLNGNYVRINVDTKGDFFNLGLRFDLPHTSARYNNTLYKFTERSKSLGTYKSQGSHISLSYFMERRESIVPERKKILEM
ncbi:MAG: hypothetical protein ACRDFC_00635, partial [Ignavibacteria bacterium]